ncbi:MAG: hypothetical protein JNM24_10670 [Bdellovibrionaceae bacterium]|nr:hypothetical protein [Pseudobdellovibrionaceae bacterium]
MSVFAVTNNRGSALGMALTFTALCTLLSFSIIEVLQAGNKLKAQSTSELSMRLFVSTLRHALNDPTLCPTILGQGQNTVTTALNSVSNITFNYNLAGGSGAVITSGYVFDNKITLSRVELKILDISSSLKNGNVVSRAPGGPAPYVPVRLATSPLWPTPWVIDPEYASLNKYLAEIKLIHNSANSMNFFWNPENQKNKIRVLIKTTATGKIMACHGETSEAEACESRGYAFDGLFSSADHRCNPDFYCRTDGQGYSVNPACTAPYKKTDVYFNTLDNQTYSICNWCNP